MVLTWVPSFAELRRASHIILHGSKISPWSQLKKAGIWLTFGISSYFRQAALLHRGKLSFGTPSASSHVCPRLENLVLPHALCLNPWHPVYHKLHFITFWLFRGVVPNDIPGTSHPPQVFCKPCLQQVFETKVLRSSLFCPRWAFEYLQVVLVFILDLRRKTMNSLHFVIIQVLLGGEEVQHATFPFSCSSFYLLHPSRR